ncbi:MAG: 4Fe-4S dicluster domain-containing protein [Candidatus Zixiibacteriota bacterium]|nr:MAG: 4Fe-4S dicluster domain-containing protein [candidate division Zixibacteria bacterium]
MKKYLEGTYKTLPLAGLVEEAGTAENYNTGGWGVFKPVFKPEICIQCLFCWVYCPDSSILTEGGKVVAIDYEHCKGCGLCSKECPTKPEKAIIMVKKDL